MEIIAQLYVFTKTPDLEARMPGFLAGLAEAGYGAIEGMYGLPPSDPAALAIHGMRYVAPHVNPGILTPPDEVLAFCRSMAARDVVSSGLLDWNARTATDYRASIAALNDIGARLRAQGFALHYHNHDFEFQEVEPGRTGMDLLLAGLDPECVSLCLDAGWVWFAGQDPARFLREHGCRVGMLHLRDFRGRESVALGQGEMDLRTIVEAAAGLPHLRALVVEQDPTTPDPLGDMQASRRFLRECVGV